MNDILYIDSELADRIEKRVRQVAIEVSSVATISTIEGTSKQKLSFILKQIAIDYNCYIKSWVTFGEAHAECYNAKSYNEDNDNTYGLISAVTEENAIIAAFMWLSDRQNFNKVAFTKGMNS